MTQKLPIEVMKETRSFLDEFVAENEYPTICDDEITAPMLAKRLNITPINAMRILKQKEAAGELVSHVARDKTHRKVIVFRKSS